MDELLTYMVWVPTLMLAIFRIAGIFATAPLLSDSSIPVVAKAMMALVLGVAVTGALAARMAEPVVMPGDWLSLSMAIGGEMLIGATIGYTASLLFMGIEMGAQQIGQQMGIALANVFNPMTEDTTNVVNVLFHLTGLAIFVTIGGHRMMISGLLETFGTVPLAGFSMNAGVLDSVVAVISAAFVLAIKVSAPAVVALFMASLAMGFIQRTMPQFNILSAGFQVRVMVALLILAVGMASLVPLIEVAWNVGMGQISQMFNLKL